MTGLLRKGRSPSGKQEGTEREPVPSLRDCLGLSRAGRSRTPRAVFLLPFLFRVHVRSNFFKVEGLGHRAYQGSGLPEASFPRHARQEMTNEVKRNSQVV